MPCPPSPGSLLDPSQALQVWTPPLLFPSWVILGCSSAASEDWTSCTLRNCAGYHVVTPPSSTLTPFPSPTVRVASQGALPSTCMDHLLRTPPRQSCDRARNPERLSQRKGLCGPILCTTCSSNPHSVYPKQRSETVASSGVFMASCPHSPCLLHTGP